MRVYRSLSPLWSSHHDGLHRRSHLLMPLNSEKLIIHCRVLGPPGPHLGELNSSNYLCSLFLQSTRLDGRLPCDTLLSWSCRFDDSSCSPLCAVISFDNISNHEDLTTMQHQQTSESTSTRTLLRCSLSFIPSL